MNLLVTGAFDWKEEELNKLRAMGHEVLFMQQEKDSLPCAPSWVEGVVCNGLFLYHDIQNFTNLRHIQLTSAGYDRIPVDYVRAHNIQIFNAHGVYSVPMAEFALAGVLALYKQQPFFARSQTERRWQKHRGLLELFGKTVCIVGCGNVGHECALRFRAFGCRVIGVNRSPVTDSVYHQVLPLAQLDEALSQSDIVVLALALAENTRYLIDQERLATMKPGAVLVNIARGGLVDTTALMEALQHHLFGAVLDVFEEEPLPESHPLWGMENVILTPHNSFVGEGNHKRMWGLVWKNLEEECS